MFGSSGAPAVLDRLRVSHRAEARAAADRLVAIGELFDVRRAEWGEEAEWAVDTWSAVGAEVAAVLRVSLGPSTPLHPSTAARAVWSLVWP
jgi:hypothetical protein